MTTRCAACEGTGVIGVDVDPDTGIWGGEDCDACAGTGLDEHAGEPDHDYDRKYRMENPA